MTLAKSFRELKVWNDAIELTTLVYQLTAEFPKAEIYGLTSQMRRAAVSIASNIAEGSARVTRKDFRNFVIIAQGSNCELQTQLVIAAKLEFASPQQILATETLSKEVGQMLSGLAKYLAAPKPSSPT